MLFRPNHLLRSLCLTSCAVSLAQSSMGQQRGLIEQSPPIRSGEVQTVSGSPNWLKLAEGTTPQVEMRIANASPQPPAVPKPPAIGGRTLLPNRETTPTDSRGNGQSSGDVTSAEKAIKNYDAEAEKEKNSEDKEAVGKEDATKRSANSLTPLQNRELSIPVRVVDLSVADLGTGSLPESAAEKQQKLAFLGRGAIDKCVHWHPSEICHYPLRFEEPMLERHGHVRFGCWQPLASGAKFFATIPLLPYLNSLRPCCEPVYAFGNYRPGSCAPLLRETLPYDQRAAVTEALALAGFFWAMPL